MRLDRDLAQPSHALPGRREWPLRAIVSTSPIEPRVEPMPGGETMRRRLRYSSQGLAILTILLVVLWSAGPAAAQIERPLIRELDVEIGERGIGKRVHAAGCIDRRVDRTDDGVESTVGLSV